jgi:cyclic nucleotide gated channel
MCTKQAPSLFDCNWFSVSWANATLFWSQEMQMRRYDVESWMRRRGLPEEMRKRVTATERFKWAQTRGVEEKELLSGLQEDLQMEIKRFISLDLVKKVELLGVMDTVVLDAICACLEQRLYIAGSTVMTKDSPIKRMLFIVHGKMLSVGPNGDKQELSTGSYCGEELLVSYLAKLGLKPRGAWIKEMKGQCVMSSHNVKCLENVDVFSLEADDLESITKNFYKHMSKPRVQGVLRFLFCSD